MYTKIIIICIHNILIFLYFNIFNKFCIYLVCYVIKIFLLLLNLGIGDWGLGNPQSPIPNPQSPKFIKYIKI